MQSQTLAIVLCTVISLSIMECRATNTSPLCEPNIIEEMPPHIKKVCLALENSNQLSSALNAYLRNEASALVYRPDELASPATGKRTDVDHVFLRFGRRR